MLPVMRVALHRLRGVKIGSGVFIGTEVFIDDAYPQGVHIEDDVTVIAGSMLLAHAYYPTHLVNVLGRDNDESGLRICQGAYVGARAVILPGVTIGTCAVIAAGSVVTRDIEAYTVAAGVPARVVRTFDSNEVVLESQENS